MMERSSLTSTAIPFLISQLQEQIKQSQLNYQKINHLLSGFIYSTDKISQSNFWEIQTTLEDLTKLIWNNNKTRLDDFVLILEVYIKIDFKNDLFVYYIIQKILQSDVIDENLIERLPFNNPDYKKELLAQLQIAKIYLPLETQLHNLESYQSALQYFQIMTQQDPANPYKAYYYGRVLLTFIENRDQALQVLEETAHKGFALALGEIRINQPNNAAYIFKLMFEVAFDHPTEAVIHELFTFAKEKKEASSSKHTIGFKSNLTQEFYLAIATENIKNLGIIRKKDPKLYAELMQKVLELEKKINRQIIVRSDDIVKQWKELTLTLINRIFTNDIDTLGRMRLLRSREEITNSVNNAVFLWEILADLFELQKKCSPLINFLPKNKTPVMDLLVLMIKEANDGIAPSTMLVSAINGMKSKESYADTISAFNNKINEWEVNPKPWLDSNNDKNDLPIIWMEDKLKYANPLTLENHQASESAKKELKTLLIQLQKNSSQDQRLDKKLEQAHRLEAKYNDSQKLLLDLHQAFNDIFSIKQQLDTFQKKYLGFKVLSQNQLWDRVDAEIIYYENTDEYFLSFDTTYLALEQHVSYLIETFKTIADEKSFEQFQTDLKTTLQDVQALNANPHFKFLKDKLTEVKTQNGTYKKLLTEMPPGASSEIKLDKTDLPDQVVIEEQTETPTIQADVGYSEYQDDIVTYKRDL